MVNKTYLKSPHNYDSQYLNNQFLFHITAPSQPPANFNITVENSTSIRVSWSEIQAIARNGIITQYEVMYEPLETFGGQIAKRSSIVNDSIFTLLLENIQEHVQYNITVRAYTEVGEGPFTSTITVRTPEAGMCELL